MTYTSSRSVLSATCARDEETRQRKKPDSGKLGIRRDHPRRQIKMKFCMVGGLQAVVLGFKFHQTNQSSSFGAVGSNLPFPTDLAIGLYNSLYVIGDKWQKLASLQPTVRATES